MIGFYQITEALHTELKKAGFNSVTFGDIMDVDLKRQSIFPLAHIMPEPVPSGTNTNTYTFEIIGMDLIDFNKEETDEIVIPFYGADNRQDILHDILYKLQQAMEQFIRGDLFTSGMQMEPDVNYNPFIERFENVLAGWSVPIAVVGPKYATIC